MLIIKNQSIHWVCVGDVLTTSIPKVSWYSPRLLKKYYKLFLSLLFFISFISLLSFLLFFLSFIFYISFLSLFISFIFFLFFLIIIVNILILYTCRKHFSLCDYQGPRTNSQKERILFFAVIFYLHFYIVFIQLF